MHIDTCSDSTIQVFTYTCSVIIFSVTVKDGLLYLSIEKGGTEILRELRRKPDPGMKDQNVLNPK